MRNNEKLGVPYNPNFAYKETKPHKMPNFDKIRQEHQIKPIPQYVEPFEDQNFGEILDTQKREAYLNFELQPHRLQYTMDDINRHHNIAHNNNPTALRHHKLILPAFTTAAFLLAAKKILVTSHDSYTKLGYDFLSSVSLPHFPLVNKIVDTFGTIKTVHGYIKPRSVENSLKLCMILGFGQAYPTPIQMGQDPNTNLREEYEDTFPTYLDDANDEARKLVEAIKKIKND